MWPKLQKRQKTQYSLSRLYPVRNSQQLNFICCHKVHRHSFQEKKQWSLHIARRKNGYRLANECKTGIERQISHSTLHFGEGDAKPQSGKSMWILLPLKSDAGIYQGRAWPKTERRQLGGQMSMVCP